MASKNGFAQASMCKEIMFSTMHAKSGLFQICSIKLWLQILKPSSKQLLRTEVVPVARK